MCHEWWQRRMCEEREASRELWDEFAKPEPLSVPEPADEEAAVTLERPEPTPLPANR